MVSGGTQPGCGALALCASHRIVDRRHVILAHALAMHDEPGERRCDLLHVVLAELHLQRTEVFEQVRFVAGAGDRNDVRPLRQQPGECDLRWRCTLLLGVFFQPLDKLPGSWAGFQRRSAGSQIGSRSSDRTWC